VLLGQTPRYHLGNARIEAEIIMNKELQKLVVFGIIVGFLTSSYVAFLITGTRQGFFSDDFLISWLSYIPRLYFAVLPFILITGPIVRKLVDRLFDGRGATKA
jgi:hypothetical protein